MNRYYAVQIATATLAFVCACISRNGVIFAAVLFGICLEILHSVLQIVGKRDVPK